MSNQCEHGQLGRTCLLCEMRDENLEITAKLAEAAQSNHRLHDKVAEYRTERDELRAEVARHKDIAAEFAQTNVEINGKWFAEKQAREATEAALMSKTLDKVDVCIQLDAAESRLRELREAVDRAMQAVDAACAIATREGKQHALHAVYAILQAALAKRAE